MPQSNNALNFLSGRNYALPMGRPRLAGIMRGMTEFRLTMKRLEKSEILDAEGVRFESESDNSTEFLLEIRSSIKSADVSEVYNM